MKEGLHESQFSLQKPFPGSFGRCRNPGLCWRIIAKARYPGSRGFACRQAHCSGRTSCLLAPLSFMATAGETSLRLCAKDLLHFYGPI